MSSSSLYVVLAVEREHYKNATAGQVEVQGCGQTPLPQFCLELHF